MAGDGGGRRAFTCQAVRETKDVRLAAGDGGNAWNNCIAVAPNAPRAVALGWQKGAFLSMDGGKTWQVISGGPHLHADLDAVLFASVLDDKHHLYIGSDGGLARVDLDDFTVAGKLTARSDYNQSLPTLQCYSTLPTRQLYGTLSVSRTHPTKGWISSGVHDNGNVYTDPGVTEPWKQLDPGDGGSTAFVEDSGLVRNITDLVTSDNTLDPLSGILVG